MRQTLSAALASAVILGWTFAGTAWGQQMPVSSFPQLPLQIGDHLFVTDTSGRQHEGTLSELSASSIKLVTPGRISELTASEVSAIARLSPDSKKNGALIGLGVGVAVGAAVGAFAAEENNTNSASGAVVGGLAYGGLGALIGVGIDALSPGKKSVIYTARAPGAARLSLRPILLPTRRGIVAHISF
jgi:hypothetical protein